ncbi:MAG: cytochrome c family protein [Acidobacteria bacterium]|nr:cytochrome c family protein [Acidobacteriota bacterium]
MRRLGWLLVPAVLSTFASAAALAATPHETPAKPPRMTCAGGLESGLPLPSVVERDPKTANDAAAFQNIIGKFLRSGTYKQLGWCVDKGVRDTGPYIDGVYYGTHPAVRIWYSPAAARWVIGGRQGDIPDGAMIIKEQFGPPPAGQYLGWSEAQIDLYFAAHYDWTFMVRDRNGAADGWYWGEVFINQDPDSYTPDPKTPTLLPAVFNTGFGLYCVRCHGSAESLLTFSSTTNMKGQPGLPLNFRDDLSWFWKGPVTPPVVPPATLQPATLQPSTTQPATLQPSPALQAMAQIAATHEQGAPTIELPPGHPSLSDVQQSTHPHVTTASMPRLQVAHAPRNPDWVSFFSSASVNPAPNPLPNENYDHIVSPPMKPQHFITSDQCSGCHSGNRYGNVMLWTDTRTDAKPLVNVSPFGEWRWSPMGLAGRDPIFYAQLESEIAYLTRHRPDQLVPITNLCFSCHGAMGERMLNPDPDSKKPQKPFTKDIVMISDHNDPKFRYGALAREGISCALCHHIANRNVSLMEFIANEAAGNFSLTPPDQLEGPFENPSTVPMNHSLGIKPVHNEYTRSARICGTCHTIPLPVVDAADDPVEAKIVSDCQHEKTSFEQATYLEWINSSYQNEIDYQKDVDPKLHPSAQTCQDCHMKGTLNGTQIQTQLAAVEDHRYPATDHLAPQADLNIPLRADGYARHQFQGLNVFLLAMFDQFNEPLGLRKCDYMTSGCAGLEPTSGIPFAMRNFAEQAALETATISVGKPSLAVVNTTPTLTADVTVTNLTGHRFPSGVSFRRAFIDFFVTDLDGNILFESGGTNSIGAIVDGRKNVLPSEYNGSLGDGGHAFQPHFWTGNPITRSDQVQIYEELLKDADGNFTTSFIRQDCHFKDNRILPLGWKKWGPDLKKFNGKPLEETWADLVGDDPYYDDPLGGKGQSVVRYQVPLPPGTKLDKVIVSAQLYYQAIPPYYLLQRFQQAPEGTGTQRLYYITQSLDASRTPFPGWKLRVAQASVP